MADLIKIKRSTTTATPPSLAAGEIAYSELSGNLFYGRVADGAPQVIGGLTDHTKLAGIEAGAQVNTVTSVAGKTGTVTLASTDLTDFNTAVDGRIGAASIDALADVVITTPANGQQLTWDSASGKWINGAPGTGVTAFTQLNDVPSAYTASGGFFVKVNAGATALEFVNGIDGGSF